MLHGPFHTLHLRIGHFRDLSCHHLPVHHGLFQGLHISGSVHLARLAETIKILGFRGIDIAFLRLEHHFICGRGCVIGQHGRQAASHTFHIWVILRLPRNQVFATSHGKLVHIVVHLKHTTPRAVRHAKKAGVEHFLLRTPRAEITFHKSMSRPDAFPCVLVRAPSEIQTSTRMHVVRHQVHRIGHSRRYRRHSQTSATAHCRKEHLAHQMFVHVRLLLKLEIMIVRSIQASIPRPSARAALSGCLTTHRGSST